MGIFCSWIQHRYTTYVDICTLSCVPDSTILALYMKQRFVEKLNGIRENGEHNIFYKYKYVWKFFRSLEGNLCMIYAASSRIQTCVRNLYCIVTLEI